MKKLAILICFAICAAAQMPVTNIASATEPNGLQELEAPIVIETEDGEEASPAEQRRIQALDAERKRDNPTVVELNKSADAAFAAGGITVVYDPSNLAPSNVQSVINSAAAEWDAIIATNPAGPIEIEVSWMSLGSTQLLGYASSEGLFRGSSLPTANTYPAALANTLAGVDANDASCGCHRPEIEIVLNSDLTSINRWYIGTGTNIGSNQVDLKSVAMHEIAHGLGFTGSASLSNGTPRLATAPNINIYDTIVQVDGAPIHSHPHPHDQLTSNNLDIHIGGNQLFKIYAPATWQDGSSYSHFDEATYPHGTPGSLMTPLFHSGRLDRNIDAPIRGVLAEIGWPLISDVVPPQWGPTSSSANTVTVNWGINLNFHALPPTQFVARILKTDGTLINTQILAGNARQATFTGLEPNTNYNVYLTPFKNNGIGDNFTIAVNTTDGPAPANFVRPLPLDAQILRLYTAHFLRNPDEAGFYHWREARANGLSPESIAQSFSTSPEFISRYGNLNNAQFVNLVYANVLNRSPDAEGYSHWLNLLNNGLSRGTMMLGFSDSTEYIIRTETVAPNTSQDGKVRRLYAAVFLRDPDAVGYSHWLNAINQSVSLDSIASEFASSPEFLARYGSLNNTQFAILVYQNVLGRNPDTNGLGFWIGQLNTGTSRGTMMREFSESPEHIVVTGLLP